jgi:hypothetical protein
VPSSKRMRPAFSEKPSRPVQRVLIAMNDNRAQAEGPRLKSEFYDRPLTFLYACGAWALFIAGLFALLR